MDSYNNSKAVIRLREEEAEALYKTGINNSCPYKYFSPQRKVWWAIADQNGNFPYTICQDCYHNNNFGDKDISIKKDLAPVMLVNMPCNCDSRKTEEGFPINIGNGWLLGMYVLEPEVGILNTDCTYLNGRLSIDLPIKYDSCNILLNFKASISCSPNDLRCSVINDGVKQQALLSYVSFEDGDQNIVVISDSDYSQLNFIKSSEIERKGRKVTVCIYLMGTYENLLEFDIYPRHISEPCSFNKENANGEYEPSTISI
jgi:hypothetical protein